MAFPAWDQTLCVSINQVWRNGALDLLMPLFSNPAFLWGVVGAGLWYRSWRAAQAEFPGRPAAELRRRALIRFAVLAVLVLLVSGASDASCNVVKKAVGRVRPLNALPGAYHVDNGQWERNPPDFAPDNPSRNSFPSAHAANSAAAVLTAVLITGGPRPWPLLALPLVVGYSRVYLGKHYPLDVAGGWLLGILIFYAGRGLIRIALARLPGLDGQGR